MCDVITYFVYVGATGYFWFKYCMDSDFSYSRYLTFNILLFQRGRKKVTSKHIDDFVKKLTEKEQELLACSFLKCQFHISEEEFRLIQSDCVYMGSFLREQIPLERRAITTGEIRVDYCKRRAERYYNGVL